MKATRSGVTSIRKIEVGQPRPAKPAANTKVTWETTGKKDPHVEPARYEALILGWQFTRPFGRRDDITFDLRLLDGPYEIDESHPTRSTEPPSDGYDDSEGAVLKAHFNIQIVNGVVRLGPGSKLARAFSAAFDGHPPRTFDPDCLVGLRVSCVASSVTHDSKDNPLHPSCWYSIVDTFVGPGTTDVEEELLF